MKESAEERELMNDKSVSPEKAFYPDYIVEVLFTIAVCIEALLIIALLYPPSVGRQIDFLKPFQPKPEWYFLWLFQLVRYFPGESAFIGAVVIPVASVLLLFFLPYLDRGQRGRLKVIVAGMLLLILTVVLTLLNIYSV
ncbi:MAG TPA: hypothetical protein VN260_05515 [Dissulfurispiraceae bacterium]|nr:hypothetical protein [Dissulfurispiraceae bacterium]